MYSYLAAMFSFWLLNKRPIGLSKNEIPCQMGFGWVSLPSAGVPSLDKSPKAPRISINLKI